MKAKARWNHTRHAQLSVSERQQNHGSEPSPTLHLTQRALGGSGMGGSGNEAFPEKKAIMPTVNKTQSLKSCYVFRFYSGHSGMLRFAISPCVLCPSKCGLIQLRLLLSLIHGYQVYSNNTWKTRLPINKFMLQKYTFTWLLREPKTMIPRW